MTYKQTIFRRAGVLAAALLSAALLVAQEPPPPPVQPQAPAQLLSPQQLDSLAAPIALYPDSLLSQVLVASTYPLEVAEAGQWLNENRGLQGQQLIDAARQQNWDPSIQALIVFPDVISRLAADIQWTTDLGNAFLAQQADVMAAVQRLRSQAMAAGQLQSNAQETVTTDYEDGQQAIEIAPVNPEVVYVPYYNPAYIWGPAAWGYYPSWCDFGFGIGFGPGIYINAFFGGIGWGDWGWGCNWFHGFLFNRPLFFSRCGFNGFVAGRPWGGYSVWSHNAYHRLGVAYPNNTLNARYGAISNSGRALNTVRYGTQPVSRSYQALGRANTAPGAVSRFGSPAAAPRSNAALGARNAYRPGSAFAPNSAARPSSGWSHFNGTPAAAPRSNAALGARNAYRPSTPAASNFANSRYSSSYGRSYTAPSYRPSPSYGRSYTAPTYRPSPSYSRSYTAPTYRSTPSYSRSYSAPSYHYSAPAYRSAPSFSHSYGGSYSAPRSFGGGGGSSFHGGGGGGSFHGGGGGGGSHSSGNSHSSARR